MSVEVKYLIKKTTKHSRQCKLCLGTGVAHNGRKCIDCNNGVAIHWHETEITLLDALHELGLIKKNNEKTS